MDESTRQVLRIAAAFFAVAAPLWSIWMMWQHWFKKDPAAKHRRTETLMMQPMLFGFCSPIFMPLVAFIVFDELKREDYPLDEALLTLGIGLLVTVFFVCYGTRQILIYDYDHLRHRPAFGKMRTYDFCEVHSMTPIIFDLLVHVGHRWILIDAQQDWHPLWEKYRSWRKRNGLPVKTRTYKTALGRAFGEIPGGIGFLVVIFLFCGGGGAFCFFVTVMAWKDELVGVSIGMLLFGLLCIATPVLISFAAINQDKHPRFSKFVIGDMKAWGKPNRKKAKPKTEDEEDA